MSKQPASADKIATKQQTKSRPTVDPLIGMAEFAGESLTKLSLGNQFGSRRLPAIQRQVVATQIGDLQGNAHLAKKLASDRNRSALNELRQTDNNFPNLVQRNDERLADREEEARFSQTRTYETFEAEVRRWLARRVLSRTRQAHRERRLVPNGFLRGYYNTVHPGEPIIMKVHFHSNGYSFRYLTFVLPGQEIFVPVNQEEPRSENVQSETPPPTPTPLPQFRRFRIRMVAGGDGGEGVGGGFYTFEIEALGKGGTNRMITFTGAGLTGGAPAGGYGPSPWSNFTTSVPRRLEEFEGAGRIAAVGVYLGVGGGWSKLVFYCNDGIQQVVEGLGVGTGLAAGASWFHGWWELRD